ncbi:hypothetical protein ES703_121995 [subsurface metagenome]
MIILQWLNKNKYKLMIWTITLAVLFVLYACDSKVRSLNNDRRLVNRAELTMQLNHIIDKAGLRFASLDRQDKLRAIIFNNALVVLQGQPFNPIGLITAVASIYGLTQVAKNTGGVIKNARAKRANNKSVNV